MKFPRISQQALACEKLGEEAKDYDVKGAWADIAIE
jgi:hypothetical protein